MPRASCLTLQRDRLDRTILERIIMANRRTSSTTRNSFRGIPSLTETDFAQAVSSALMSESIIPTQEIRESVNTAQEAPAHDLRVGDRVRMNDDCEISRPIEAITDLTADERQERTMEVKAVYEEDKTSLIGAYVFLYDSDKQWKIDDFYFPIHMDYDGQGARLISQDGERKDVYLRHIGFLRADAPEDNKAEKVKEIILKKFKELCDERTDRLHKDESSHVSAIGSLKLDIRHREERIKAIQEEIAALGKSPFSEEKLLKDIEELKSHPLVEKVFFSKSRKLVIHTKMLKKLAVNTGKPTRTDVGRFEITVKPFAGLPIRARNLDYEYMNCDHPNVRNAEICMGENKEEIYTMLENADIYPLIDFLIVFLSTTHHQGDSTPYVDPYDWLSDREKKEAVRMEVPLE